MGLWGATSANMLNMIGIGPFVTIPLALAAMGGPQVIAGWIAGAVLAICDGLVWAELGSAMPDSGGPYHYLSQAFGTRSYGRLLSFLFLWQACLTGPVTVASGAIGFAQYATYLVPSLTPLQLRLLAATVCLLTTALLYRDIRSVNKLSVTIWVVVMATMGWILFGGLTHFDSTAAFDFKPGAFTPTVAFWSGLGSATLIAMYDYSGYYTACLVGEELEKPAKIIPRAVLLSIGIIAAFYLAMNLSVLSVLPPSKIITSKAVMADFMEALYGRTSAQVLTALVLWAAFASVFAILLGYSRIPYTAATEGRFFKPFARLHPTKRFPTFALLAMGLGACACSLFLDLDQLIKIMLVLQIMLQFAAQCVAVVLLRKYRRDIEKPYRMPLYPLPAGIAFFGWLCILDASGWQYVAIGTGCAIAGALAFLASARRRREWPFAAPADS
jgi:amino acid transporter